MPLQIALVRVDPEGEFRGVALVQDVEDLVKAEVVKSLTRQPTRVAGFNRRPEKVAEKAIARAFRKAEQQIKKDSVRAK